MNYEQKHQKDLEAANGWLALAKENNNTIAIQILEKFFPELKESEDEKIRKEIYRYFRDLQLSSDREFSPSISIDEILAWLEKQDKTSFDEEWIKLLKNANIQYQMSMTEDMVDGAAKLAVDGLKKLKIYEIVERYVYKQGENKSVGNVEPKFKIDDWVQIDGGHVMKILEVKKDVLCYRILNWCGNESVRKISDIDSIAHLWTIQDAKNGDVLVYPDGTIVIFKYRLDGLNSGVYMSHILLATKIEISQSCAVSKDITPATKEQSDLLFQKMKETGYEWDAEKKELKKIEQKLSCSEEDEKMIDTIIYDLERHGGKEDSSYSAEINWLKELKERIQPHPKQEWNKEDSERLDRIYKFIWANRKGDTDEIYQQEQDADWLMTLKPQPEQGWSVEDDYVYNEILKRVANKKLYEHDLEYIYTWLKSLKSQNRWKPSDEQLKTLWDAIVYVEGCHSNFRGGCMLESLYKDLKKL